MTAEERKIANAALGAGSGETDQIVIAIAARLELEPQHNGAVLQRLRIRMVLNCVSTSQVNESAVSVRYEKGLEWTDVVRIVDLTDVLRLCPPRATTAKI